MGARRMTATQRNRRGPGLSCAAAVLALPLLGILSTNAAPNPVVEKRLPTPNAQRRTPNAPPGYNRDVRPILAENCFPCHGPDSAARKADLRLDRPQEATADRGGRAAIVPGKPETSELVRRLTTAPPALRMPPLTSHKSVTPEQVATLKRWIAAGARYELHWAYIPPRLPAVPAIPAEWTGGLRPSPRTSGAGARFAGGGTPDERTNGRTKHAGQPQRAASPDNLQSAIRNPQSPKAWPRNPIDAFVLDRLLKAGLTPAPEADRRTLARRLSLDLTGLPPDPADVEAFLKDTRPDAYEQLVEKYLASPHWGEHRGRYWLDAARYADTHGIHFDNFREVWSYRDWVINAFNRNQPFDQFSIEQLAGDLLPNPTLDQRIATGFNRCNITTNEGGAIAEEYLVLYTRDRTETVAQTWLGSTAGCAVCHDHKFDPLSQREFYELAAFFNNTTQAAMDGNIRDTPPVVLVPLREDRPRYEQLSGELKAARDQAEARKQAARADFDRWLASVDVGKIRASVPEQGLRFHASLSEGQGKELAVALDGEPLKVPAAAEPTWAAGHVAEKAFQRKAASVVELPAVGDIEKDQPFTVAAWVKLARPDQGGAIVARMDDQHDFRGWDLWLEGGRVGTHLIHAWPADALKVVSREPLRPKEWHHVCVTYSGGANPESVRVYQVGVPMATDVQANALKSTIRTTVPFKIGQRHTTSGIDGAAIQDLRLYGRALSVDEAQRLARGTRAAFLASRAAQLAAAEKDELFSWWLPGVDEPFRALATKLAVLEDEERAIKQRGTIAHVTHERGEPAMAHILFRGEYDRRKDAVKADTPDVLPAWPADLPKNRLGFAKWLMGPEHPLTARVTVNRFWQEVFGTGLVRTAGDFGTSGELPSHPELLDWLAVRFARGSMDVRTYGSVDEKRPTSPSSTRPHLHTSTLLPAPPWDVKALFRLIVTSATYRQASITTPEKKRKDAQNRLLSRGPRYRMDAEMIRDYALASSGLLVPKLGGPSVKPYQPPGVWEAVAMIGSNTRDYKPDTGENLYRRSMYTFWKRAAPPASMDIFNAPNRETCAVRRERTNTPLQALVTLNDPQYVEAARHLAQRALKEGGSTLETRANFLAGRLLARPLRPEELAVVRNNLADLESFYREHAKEAAMLIAVGESKADPSLQPEILATWTMLANQLMNLDEVLNK